MVDSSNSLTILDSFVPAVAASHRPPVQFGHEPSPPHRPWHDFFAGVIGNDHTRAAYLRAVRRFFHWLPSDLALSQITPGIVGRYIHACTDLSIPTRKLHLAALRAFFDLLVERHIVLINPAAAIRGPRYQAVEGRTPEITLPQARSLIATIRVRRPSGDGSEAPDSVGLRDRAVIGVMFYTAARAGAVAKLTLKSIRGDVGHRALRFEEKGGKSREIPLRHDLWQWIEEYLAAAPFDAPTTPLFRTASRRTGQLTSRAMTNIDICRMVKRRSAIAGLSADLSPHSFRVATLTDLLTHGASLEDVQALAGHADPRTTRLYDRRPRRITRNLVERLSNLTD